ncbi:MAG: hypothetical protein HY537_03390 [Deltaproteobacteria bacterium]|nr:hypothetical protein [Deltaproteobacteria bacterium]
MKPILNRWVLVSLFIFVAQDAFAWRFRIGNAIRARRQSSNYSQNLEFSDQQLEMHAQDKVFDTNQPSDGLNGDGRSINQEATPKNADGNYASGRFYGSTFQYKGVDGNWITPPHSYVADNDGSFSNQAGQAVTYKKGDILFGIDANNWFKASGDSEKVAAPISHNQPGGRAGLPSPQEAAQERANRMAAYQVEGHLDNGAVATNIGTLYEGVGWGTGTPGTCVAQDGSAPLADASAVGSDGVTYRVRLYHCGTMYPNGKSDGGRSGFLGLFRWR